MTPRFRILVLSSAVLLLLLIVVYSSPSRSSPPSKLPTHQHPIGETVGETLDKWLRKEEHIALEKILANIAPFGRNVPDGLNGTVIASPSHYWPDYYYQWVRDAAIVIGGLVPIYANPPNPHSSSSIPALLASYASLQHVLQNTPTPSGPDPSSSLANMGEPKFYVTGEPFTGPWGRPQHDGPALRALALIAYLRAYNASNPDHWTDDAKREEFFKPLYEASMPANSVIKKDLEYVSQFWNKEGIDVWEEVSGLHFFTAMAQRKALKQGAQIARAFDDVDAAKWYDEQAGKMKDFISEKFWDDKVGYIKETVGTQRTGLDCAVLLGSLHGLDYEEEGGLYEPWSDEVLATLVAFVQDQRRRFPVNNATGGVGDDESEVVFEGVGLGRYPEDVYDGVSVHSLGNPWYLCTSSAAEVLYRTAAQISAKQSFKISERGLPFFEALLASSSLKAPEVGREYGRKEVMYYEVLQRLKNKGDEFLEVVRMYAGQDGSLSEQFDRNTGVLRGAKDLTWSYSAFMQVMRARKMVL